MLRIIAIPSRIIVELWFLLAIAKKWIVLRKSRCCGQAEPLASGDTITASGDIAEFWRVVISGDDHQASEIPDIVLPECK